MISLKELVIAYQKKQRELKRLKTDVSQCELKISRIHRCLKFKMAHKKYVAMGDGKIATLDGDDIQILEAAE